MRKAEGLTRGEAPGGCGGRSPLPWFVSFLKGAAGPKARGLKNSPAGPPEGRGLGPPAPAAGGIWRSQSEAKPNQGSGAPGPSLRRIEPSAGVAEGEMFEAAKPPSGSEATGLLLFKRS